MGKFFEFMEKIRIEKMLLEQEMPQPVAQQPAPEQPQQNVAQDATPEQQDAGESPKEDSGLSPTAHDENFSKLIDAMKQALPDLKPENRKLVDEFLKSNNLSGGDEPTQGEQPQDQATQQPQDQDTQPPQDQAAAQPMATPQQ